MEDVEDLKNQIKKLNRELKDANERIESLEGSFSFPFFDKALDSNEKQDNKTDLIYQLMFESISEGIVFFDAQGKVKLINEGAKKILGSDLLEFQNKLAKIRLNMVDENFESIPFDNQPAVIVLKSKEPVINRQIGVKLKGESYQWLLINAQPVYNYNEEFIGALLSLIDISEIKLRRDELKLAKINLELAQEISRMGSFILHLKTNRIEWSDELFRIFEVSKEDFKDDFQFYLNKITYEEDLYKINRRNELIKKLRPVDPIEYRIKLPDGRIRLLWSHVGKVLMDAEGNPDIVVGVVTDITDRKKEEERKLFEQANQQVLRLESLRFLAGGIAHDFNNLLGGIYGFLDLASNESQEPNVQKYLEGALKSMGRARSLTDKLITFTESGAPNREITEISDLIVDTANFVLSGTSITCEFNISKDLWYCAIDKAQIEQVIENIVLNALQSMNGKGKLFISAENIIDGGSSGTTKFVKITIRDTGMGMTKDTLDHVFEPFYTTKTEGHGLGLATSYSIIKKHDGFIKVESELHKGSSFIILIPTTEKSNVIIKEEPIKVEKSQDEGIIIILDDEEDILEILKINLQKLGYTVIAKTKGEEILEIMQNYQIVENLKGLFLDLTIPGGLSGKDLINELRKQFSALPIYVISGYSDDPIITRPQDYGFTASLKKPFIFSELEKLLSTNHDNTINIRSK